MLIFIWLKCDFMSPQSNKKQSETLALSPRYPTMKLEDTDHNDIELIPLL